MINKYFSDNPQQSLPFRYGGPYRIDHDGIKYWQETPSPLFYIRHRGPSVIRPNGEKIIDGTPKVAL